MKKLSGRQQAIFDYICAFLDNNDYPPTIRDIQGELGISSTSVVDYNLKVLEQRNLIRRNKNISRGIEVVGRESTRTSMISIPVIGQIAAGLPIPVPEAFSENDVLSMIELSPDLIRNHNENLFALKVKGLSMIDAFINDGDIVILKQTATCENGETVAVWLKDERETTLKRFYVEEDRIRLQPENRSMDPMYTSPENVEIQGKLVCVHRQID